MSSPSPLRHWTWLVPAVALVLLVVLWPKPHGLMLGVAAFALAGAVLAAVHHAEVIAHRVGEPFGSLVLALAVTTIEVALIVSLIASGGKDDETLARDTVFAAVMITMNGILGISLLIAALRDHYASFNAEASATMLASVATLATLTLVLPTFTTSAPGPEFSATQLTFAAAASLALYLLFVFVQTIRHRESFVGEPTESAAHHGERPSTGETLTSFGLLLVALVGVVGLAKMESPAIDDAIDRIGAPQSAVGVVVALLVLLPEALSAMRSARRGQLQTSFNLAFGSAMASIGLTIPAIAIASIWLDGRLVLGLDTSQIVLFAISVAVASLTVIPGRATLQESGIHLVLFAAFIVLAINP